jgi:hypothetical protein
MKTGRVEKCDFIVQLSENFCGKNLATQAQMESFRLNGSKMAIGCYER